jgi:hypothetical protein
MKYKYQIKSTGSNSDKYGVCEVCEQKVSDVHSQTELREYRPGRWTEDKGSSHFGHKDCLEKQRRLGQLLHEEIDKYDRHIFIVDVD